MSDGTAPVERTPAFDERQRLPSWIGPVVLVLSVSPLAAVTLIVFDESGVTAGSIATVAAILLPGLGVVPLVYRSELRTLVRDDGVYFRFRPFHRSWRSIRFDEIDAVPRDERRSFSVRSARTNCGRRSRTDCVDGKRN